MPTPAFSLAIQNILDMAALSLERRLSVPSLILLYAGIDTVANLERGPGEGNRRAFVKWVDAFLQPARPLPCTSLELYSARCAILHTGTPDSDLTEQGGARRLFYAWGSGVAENLERVSLSQGHQNVVVVNIGDVAAGLRIGYSSFLSAIYNDPPRFAAAATRAFQCLVDIEPALVDRGAEAIQNG
jgi:hypothetical protein